MYRAAMTLCIPAVRWWGQLEVVDLRVLPESGPTLLVGNHDSYWDPVAVGVAALGRRQVQALAKDSLWRVPGLSPVLNGMGQIPIIRGGGDAGAMARAEEELRAGACIGVFPEGTRTKGSVLAARGGIGRLARAVPEATVVCCAITGTVDIVKAPARPRVRVEFFRPATVDMELSDRDLAARLLEEIRARAPIVAAGRKVSAA
jgi:1-acyl-sn-glycerol-3-phosphate acyltransferase